MSIRQDDDCSLLYSLFMSSSSPPPADPHSETGKGGITVEAFAAATFLYAANLAHYLRLSRKTFLRDAGRAFDIISRENRRRKAGVVDEKETPP